MTASLPERMTVGESAIHLDDYLHQKAISFCLRHPEHKEGFSANDIRDMMVLCIEDRDAPEETERWWDELLEEVCQDLHATEQFNKHNMTTEVTPFLDQEIVNAAKNTTMAHGFKELLEKYDFGLDFVEIKSRIVILLPAPEGMRGLKCLPCLLMITYGPIMHERLSGFRGINYD